MRIIKGQGTMSKTKIQRNEPCPCGSGKKYKQCCALLVVVAPQSSAGKPVSLPKELALALAAFNAGQLDESAVISDRILELNPQYADALHLRGLVDFHRGEFSPALDRIKAAILINPAESSYFYNLGTVLLGMNNQIDAIDQFRMSIKLNPNDADAHGNLAAAFSILGKHEEAKRSHMAVIKLKPNDASALSSYAATLNANGEYKEAISLLVKALAISPDHADALNNLGLAAQRTGLEAQAEVLFRRSSELDPGNARLHFNLSDTLKNQSRLEEAIKSCRDGLALRPSHASAHSNLLLFLQYSPDHTPEQVYAEHLLFAEQFEAPLVPQWISHFNSREPGRRLRIGYVSADFREHAVARFITPILMHHDHALVEIFCYYNHDLIDATTQQLMALVPNWVPCLALNEDELAARIRADGIDILVDLSGHTAGNRLLTFARKPAPVQITFGGYPGTTGLSAMNYRVSDPLLDPVGLSEQNYTEQLMRLDSAVIYQPFDGCPNVNKLPALSGGFFTFACLNNLIKITPRAIQVWSAILARKPNSRLILGNLDDERTRERLLGLFAAEGITADRLIMQPKMALLNYLATYQQIDLALDTFPYTGGTTTNDSMWMGVPVLTLAGQSLVSRSTTAAMQMAGFPHFVTTSEDEYIEQALAISNDLEGLNAVRQVLRERLASNSAKDPIILTRQFEGLVRDAWREWCNPQ